MPAFARSSKPTATITATPPPPSTAAASSSKALPTDLPSSASNLTQQSLSVLYQFLSYADPESASLLPLSPPSNNAISSSSIPTQTPAQPEIPIPEWTVLYTTTTPSTTPGGFSSSTTVRSHPDPYRYLFSVQSTLPGVTARQFWSLMASAENRKLWDNTVEEATVKRWLSSESRAEGDGSAEMARAVAARVELLRFGSIFMVAKARDMVLLSVDARLPSNGPLRLVSTSQSIVHPSLPPRKGYTRFELRTGGFMVEDLGDDRVPDIAASELGKSPSSATSTNGSHIRKGLLALGRRGRSNSSSSSTGNRHLRQASDSVDSPQQRSMPIRDPRGPAVRITQVSDLGEMAAWVPASVIKMVASTLVPRSIASVAKVAKMMPVAQVLYSDYDQRGAGRGDEEVVAERLGENGGTWYRHRMLPEMVGRGVLKKPKSRPTTASKQVVAPASAEVPATTTPEPLAARLSDVPEVAPTTEAKDERDSEIKPKPPPLKDSTNIHHHHHHHQDIIAPTQYTTAEPITAASAAAPSTPSSSSAPKSLLPPRTSSLPPSSPSLDRHTPSFSGSPNKPLSPSSPLSSRPAMLLDLGSLDPPQLFPSHTGATRTSSSPGLFASTDSDLGGSVSSLTPSFPAASRMCGGKKFNIPPTPSEGTETVPGSVAASDFEAAASDYLTYGVLEKQFKRATLNLAQQDGDRESQEILDDAGEETGDVTIRQPFPGSASPASPLAMGLMMSPAEKRSRLLSNEYFPAHIDAGGNRSADNEAKAAREMDQKMRRLSSALYAEMERRQLSGSGFSPRTNQTRPLSPLSPHPPHSTLPPLPNINLEEQRTAPLATAQSSDLVALLADALSESLPYIPTTASPQDQEREIREQVRRVSAMLLAGSDALALSLAPGARDSLGLQLDGLSTPTEEEGSVRSSVSSAEAKKAGNGKAKARYGEGLGAAGGYGRSRKVSVNSMGRNISVGAAAKADVVASTESVISVRRPHARSTTSTTPSSSAAGSSHFTHPSTANTSLLNSVPDLPTAVEAAQGTETKAVESLRELEKGSRRSVRAVKRNLVTSAPTTTCSPTQNGGEGRYGARLLSGLAYYSGYSWYYASTSPTCSSRPSCTASCAQQRDSLATTNGGGLVRPISTRCTAHKKPRIPSNHSIGRRKTRANYRLENNCKLHPFPGSLGKRAGLAGAFPVHTSPNGGNEDLPPPITGFGVGRMRRYAATDAESGGKRVSSAGGSGVSAAAGMTREGEGIVAEEREEEGEDESWEDDLPSSLPTSSGQILTRQHHMGGGVRAV
ncbi:uncharacterized protein UHOR_00944 [Ustilago hordei]|uniref:START domain-containing protein n=1 Tax=Ustilago hordei TaxID=120017 RepID=I2FVZ5_USTHO|nr:uncharacterized protein UHOR_00944 [Ustilago hordei]